MSSSRYELEWLLVSTSIAEVVVFVSNAYICEPCAYILNADKKAEKKSPYSPCQTTLTQLKLHSVLSVGCIIHGIK